MIAGTLSGICEALTYAQAQGLDLHKLVASLATGAAGSKQLDAFGEKIIGRGLCPGLFLKHFVKDMGLGPGEAQEKGLSLEVLGPGADQLSPAGGPGLWGLGHPSPHQTLPALNRAAPKGGTPPYGAEPPRSRPPQGKEKPDLPRPGLRYRSPGHPAGPCPGA